MLGNTDIPAVHEAPEALDIIAKFQVVDRLGWGETWHSMDSMEYYDLLCIMACMDGMSRAERLHADRQRSNANMTVYDQSVMGDG